MAKDGRPPASLDEWLDWKQRLESQKASGLSVEVYCLQEGVSRSSFYRWQRQLKSGVPAALLEEEADRRRTESEEVDRGDLSADLAPSVARGDRVAQWGRRAIAAGRRPGGADRRHRSRGNPPTLEGAEVMTNFSELRVFLCMTPTSMNFSFDRLMGLAERIFNQDPLSGHLFLFVNRDRDRIKILFWDRDGFCIWYKRLERGVFELPAA